MVAVAGAGGEDVGGAGLEGVVLDEVPVEPESPLELWEPESPLGCDGVSGVAGGEPGVVGVVGVGLVGGATVGGGTGAGFPKISCKAKAINVHGLAVQIVFSIESRQRTSISFEHAKEQWFVFLARIL